MKTAKCGMRGLGARVWGLGLRVLGLGFGVSLEGGRLCVVLTSSESESASEQEKDSERETETESEREREGGRERERNLDDSADCEIGRRVLGHESVSSSNRCYNRSSHH